MKNKIYREFIFPFECSKLRCKFRFWIHIKNSNSKFEHMIYHKIINMILDYRDKDSKKLSDKILDIEHVNAVECINTTSGIGNVIYKNWP